MAALPHLAAVVSALAGVSLVGHRRCTEKGFATKIRVEVQGHFTALVEHAYTVGILLLVSSGQAEALGMGFVALVTLK